jgi:hypothetical protein
MIQRVPENWLDTKEVHEWLRHRDFPYDTVPNMLNYVHHRFGRSTLDQLVKTDDSFPQSYAHWWCTCRMAQLQHKEARADYSVLQKWSAIALTQTGNGTVEAVFALLYNWLDTLSLDRFLFSDEQHRAHVPRLSQGRIVLENVGLTESRKSTVNYLVEQGHAIFQERGWTVGDKFWEENCQKYQF